MKPSIRIIAKITHKNGRNEVHHLDQPNSSSLGYLRSNSLWLPSPYAPATTQFIVSSSGKTFVRIAKQWPGFMRRGNEQFTFDFLRQSGLLKEEIGYHFIPLEIGNEVEIHLSPFTVFISSKHIDPKLRLSAKNLDRSGSFKAIPWLYLGFLLFSLVTHLGLLNWLKNHPVSPNVSMDVVAKEFQRIQVNSVNEATKEVIRNLESKSETSQAKPKETPAPIIEKTKRSVAARTKTLEESAKSLSSVAGTFSSVKPNPGGNGFGTSKGTLGESGFSSLASGLGLGQGSGLGSLGKAIEGGPSSNLGSSLSKSSSIDANIQGPSLASISSDHSKSEGSLDSQLLYGFLSSRSGQLQGCYEQALEKNPSLSGKATIEVTISSEGKASKVNVRGEELNDSRFKDCLVRKIQLWQFPKPSGGSVSMRFPLIFSSSGRG